MKSDLLNWARPERLGYPPKMTKVLPGCLTEANSQRLRKRCWNWSQ